MRKICPDCGEEKYFYFDWEQRCTSCQKAYDLKCTQEEIAAGEDPDTGSSDYIICPYCGEAIETCYGYEDFPELYEEGDHDYECEECGKTFVINSSCSWWYETSKKEDSK